MKRQGAETDLIFPVVCVWCGSELRRDTAPASRGQMCQPCFRRMVEEQARPAATAQAQVYASER